MGVVTLGDDVFQGVFGICCVQEAGRTFFFFRARSPDRRSGLKDEHRSLQIYDPRDEGEDHWSGGTVSKWDISLVDTYTAKCRVGLQEAICRDCLDGRTKVGQPKEENVVMAFWDSGSNFTCWGPRRLVSLVTLTILIHRVSLLFFSRLFVSAFQCNATPVLP